MEKTLQSEANSKSQIPVPPVGPPPPLGAAGRVLGRGFKQPKYIIPLILLPFILLFYYIFHNWGGGTQPMAVQKDSIPANQINPNMPGVSPEVTDARIKDKFGAYLEAYQHNKDASALDNIDNNPLTQGNGFSSAYSAEDLRRLQATQKMDSLKNALNTGQQNINRQMAGIYAGTNRKQSYPNQGDLSSQEVANGVTFNAERKALERVNKTDSYNEQMQLFRDQMNLLDSMQQGNTGKQGAVSDQQSDNPAATGGRRKTLTNNFDKGRFDPDKDSSFRPLKVSRTLQQTNAFNTLSASKPADEIKAIIDQDLKAIAGSRVRIRLLSDIFVGGKLIPQGTYLYGIVTGFQIQRVNISINQVLNDNIPLPVQLDVFDIDGYLGLYVPGSTFREFTKEIGTQGTQGLSQVRTSDNSNVTTGLVNQVFQSASTSVSKLIQKEKAFLKYNYIVYLRSRN
ncbi:conjugative transposon protein TraM [Niabella hirudinis]|uniref:conjugative transposon protein TraM n=1 Tax=Niabella hirudinis TaxID=1285929 RepID=UPI003EBF2AEE